MFSKASSVEAKTDFLCLDSARQLLTAYTVCMSGIGSVKIKNTDCIYVLAIVKSDRLRLILGVLKP